MNDFNEGEPENPLDPYPYRFYVYTYTNSLTGEVFYVGKGSDDRHTQHVKEAARKNKSNPSPLISAIRSIWAQGGKVIIRKVRKDMGPVGSIQHEKTLILLYGYEQLVNRPHYKRRNLARRIEKGTHHESATTAVSAAATAVPLVLDG